MVPKHQQCRELLGNLSDYVDGELSEQLCKKIEQHMQECEHCRIVVDTLRKTVTLYHQSAAEPIELPEDVRRGLFHALNLKPHS